MTMRLKIVICVLSIILGLSIYYSGLLAGYEQGFKEGRLYELMQHHRPQGPQTKIV